jgi:ABC-2 type transport system ATP-binding protein
MTAPLVADTLPDAAVAATPLAAGAAAAIQVDRLSKKYPRPWFTGSSGAARPALDDVSFRIEAGEMVGLLGPNGAGKTTLLKSIATMVTPSSGRVLLHGCDTHAEASRARAMLGLVTSDERSFYWRLSGRQNLQFFAALYGVPRREVNGRIETLLGVLGLTEAGDRLFHAYSSGMKQKMAIARGLLAQPRVVLYDEPTRALDPLSAQNIRRWILDNRNAHGQTTHLIATNQLHEAEQLCDRVLIIDRGRLIAFDRIERLRRLYSRVEIHVVTCRGLSLALDARPENGLLKVEAAAPAEPGATTLRLSVAPQSGGLSVALAALLRMGGTIVRCDAHEPSLDEIFCSLLATAADEGGHQ